MPENVVVDIYGKFACFTRSNAKVERVSYDAPTPSACRGALEAIYFKPGEFHYQIKKIEIMKPIRYINIKRNEVNKKAVLDGEPIIVEESRTQRNNIYLRDVYYRIHAEIIKEKGCEERVTQQSLIDQFNRRVKSGKCFHQPYLGLRECMAFFTPPDPDIHPISESEDLGIMLYDNFDIKTHTPLDTAKGEGNVYRTFYHPYICNGVINVPDFAGREVRKEDV